MQIWPWWKNAPKPRVYYAIEALTRRALVRPDGTVPSRSGPDRTVVRTTPAGSQAVAAWLATPVEHVRDARSLLLLKLLFLDRRGEDSRPLLSAQRERFESIARRLGGAVNEADGFEETLLKWRLESATAALRFIDSIIEPRARAESRPRPTDRPREPGVAARDAPGTR